MRSARQPDNVDKQIAKVDQAMQKYHKYVPNKLLKQLAHPNMLISLQSSETTNINVKLSK